MAETDFMMISMTISPPELRTELHVGHHLLNGDLIRDVCKKYGTQIAIIADDHVKNLYGIELSKKLSAQIFEIPRGENAKTREVKHKIEDQLLGAGYGRDAVLIGLGGGSTTDLAGFIAATYLRGVALILIPTSLLGMVDAAIGGKTAVDTSLGKNMIGSFYHPKAIISDLETLKTLPEKEIINGFSEIIKMGLIYDPEILAFAKPFKPSKEIVAKAAKAKIGVLAQDPFEKGMRRILNFGHTIGHALETISHYKISHGEAVAIGCLAESYLSFQLGYLPEQQFQHIENIYNTHLGTFCLPKSYDRKALVHFMAFDKKNSIHGIRFVVIDKIGHPVSFEGEFCRTVKEDDLASTLSYMEKRCA